MSPETKSALTIVAVILVIVGALIVFVSPLLARGWLAKQSEGLANRLPEYAKTMSPAEQDKILRMRTSLKIKMIGLAFLMPGFILVLIIYGIH